MTAEDTGAQPERGRLAGLIVMLVTVPALAWLERKSTDPDFPREMRMRAARAGEKACATAAYRLWRAAEWCRVAYERDRA